MAKTLKGIPWRRADRYQQAALMRLQIKLTGETHRLLRDYLSAIRNDVLAAVVEDDGTLTPMGFAALLEGADTYWRVFFKAWLGLFMASRREAAMIPLGALAVHHAHFIGMIPKVRAEALKTETRGRIGDPGRPLLEQEGGEALPFPVFEPQLQEILDAAAHRIYSDGFILSDRIWNLDAESLESIRQILSAGMTEGESAWNMAKDLEPMLGFANECPRWTSTRLRLTKKEIAAGDTRGLISGWPCESKGVAYNALRLARNENQIVHHMATDHLFGLQPWIEKDRIMLSPAHPVQDICDDVIDGAPEADGVYPKGEILLPIHVQCLCYKEAVLMDPMAFARRLRGWVTGEAGWAAMDQYALSMGLDMADLETSADWAEPWLGDLGSVMTRWLWAAEPELDSALGQDSG